MNPKGRIDPTGETEQIAAQLKEAREMLAYYQEENRKLKAVCNEVLPCVEYAKIATHAQVGADRAHAKTLSALCNLREAMKGQL